MTSKHRRGPVATFALAFLLAAGCASDDGSTSGASPSVPDTAAPPTTSATATEGSTSAEVLTAAQAFLATLGDDEKSAVVAERTQDNLAQWSNLPDQLFERTKVQDFEFSRFLRRF